MNIRKIKLSNFRNYESTEISLSPNINIIYGDNAQGKTNLLEAIYIASIGKSYRADKEVEVIKFKEPYSRINLEYEKNDKIKNIEFFIDSNNKKQIKHGDTVVRSSDHIGEINVVIFSPDSMNIIKGSPSKRRKFLDILICQISKTYLYNLQQYNKILKLKNSVLKSDFDRIDNTYLDILDEKLSEFAYLIISDRNKMINYIKEKAEKIHENLTCKKESFDIKYISDYKNLTQQDILSSLKKSRKQDIMRKMSTKGPQKDDFEVYINEKKVDVYGSQGQKRTSLLTLKLSEFEVLMEKKEERPILLLDDVLSELDNSRIIYLLEYIQNYQTILTTTEIDIIKKIKNANLFNVTKGNIKIEGVV